MSGDGTKEVMIKTLALAKEQLQNYKVQKPNYTNEKIIERLRLHAFKLRRSNPGSVSHDLAARSIEEACAEIDLLRKDVARYRWLREWKSMEGLPYPTPPWVVRCELDPFPTTKSCYGAALDAAIDEAMKVISDTTAP